MEILFLIALGLNPRQLKKDWNGQQEYGLLKKRKPFVTEKKSKPVQNELENLYMEYLAQHKNCFL